MFGEKSYFVLGIRRSGNHAIANWMFPQLEGNIRYFNDFRFISNRLNEHTELRRTVCVVNNEEVRDFKGDVNCSLFGLENQSIKEFYDLYEPWETKINDVTNTVLPKDKKVIVIIRNPWNNMASEIQWKYSRGSWNIIPEDLIRLWNEYYYAYINNTYPDAVFILYDKWFTDENYRKTTSEKLGINFTDKNLEKVHYTGNGSSFNKQRYDGYAQKMNVLKRYDEVKLFPEFQQFIHSDNSKDLKDKWNNLCNLENIKNLKIE